MAILHVSHVRGQPVSEMTARSKRYHKLEDNARKRYNEQISIADGIDPYTLKKPHPYSSHHISRKSKLPPLRSRSLQ